MPTITPFLWFDSQAEEAMRFYTSIFADARVLAVHTANGRTMSVEFELQGQRFHALNAGPHQPFTDAISFFIACETQEEIDALWAKLTAGGGAPGKCGWLKDRFGVSWQVVPNALGSMFRSEDREAAGRAMQAMLQMTRLDIAALQRAFEGGRA